MFKGERELCYIKCSKNSANYSVKVENVREDFCGHLVALNPGQVLLPWSLWIRVLPGGRWYGMFNGMLGLNISSKSGRSFGQCTFGCGCPWDRSSLFQETTSSSTRGRPWSVLSRKDRNSRAYTEQKTQSR